MLLELGHDRGVLAAGKAGPFRYNLNFAPLRAAVGIVSPGALGIVDNFPYWNAVFDLYRKDELEAAVELMEQIGIGAFGDYGMVGDIVYLEAATGSESEIMRVHPRLEIEFVPDHTEFVVEDFAQAAVGLFEEVLAVFGDAAPPVSTLLCLLTEHAVIPTAMWRDGYFTPKRPYGKICLPMPQSPESILQNGFRRGLLYQFAHETTSAQAELWLLEAATVLVKEELEPVTAPWRSPNDANRSLVEILDTDEAIHQVREARELCRKVGREMLRREGPVGLVRCLAEHASLMSKPGLGSVTDRALKAVYGQTAEELFQSVR